jgi:hypothetical protein
MGAPKSTPRKVVEAETEAGSDMACHADMLIYRRLERDNSGKGITSVIVGPQIG